jgi:hypothetical protein
MAVSRPEQGRNEQGSENDGKTDQIRRNLSLAHDRKLSATAGDEGTTAASPPPAGTQIWPAMNPVYGTTRHSLQRVGCRIRVVTW